METEAEKIEKAKEAQKRIEDKLKEHGMGVFLARLLAAVIIAGVAVAVSILSTSCSVSYTKLPDGTVTAQGAVVRPVHVTK